MDSVRQAAEHLEYKITSRRIVEHLEKEGTPAKRSSVASALRRIADEPDSSIILVEEAAGRREGLYMLKRTRDQEIPSMNIATG